VESNLVRLGGLPDRNRRDFGLVFVSQASSAASFCSCSAGCDIFADDLASALELFFCDDPCDCAAGPAVADQIP
jgi:hypothetical protein